MSSDYNASNIDIDDVKFVEIIKQTDRAFLCRARWQDKDCVLKVFAPYRWRRWDPPFRSIDLFKNESRTYSRLKARGFCERGSVPDFYGMVENIDPEAKGWQPQLKEFYDKTFPQGHDPEARPNGVLMEYVPDVNIFDISNYTEERARKFHQLLMDIHEAGIVHLDPYFQNMLIQGDSDRVLWIDYELAQIFDPEHSEHPDFSSMKKNSWLPLWKRW
ncbi:hypothetical protein PEX2_083080 [Penicillium expansum]|uniref:Lipopolysaccharide kinase n=1 Tax=Penicillium expansum TaxID=27334 RepID=A0A0A2JBN5_PENEN|nr:hypothetical protein PEX2_083080 [Penicillium expansum]KGO43564.1 hypothetical protein PEXP_094660 [Penicillium expansum]KGO52774.1 hypothetical protein PEX2_083080 [Penicillium expansum]